MATKSNKKASTLSVNPTAKATTIKIDGNEYSLIYSFRAIAQAERLTGVNLLLGLNTITALTGEQFHGLLFAALLPSHPDITAEQVDALIRIDTLPILQIALADALMASMPKPKESADRPTEPAEAA